MLAGQSIAIGAGQGRARRGSRASTDEVPRLTVAEAAGYGPFYICTDDNGVAGAMGQHYVKGDLVGDGAIDPLDRRRSLVYEPMPGGGSRARRRRVRRLQGRLGRDADVGPARSCSTTRCCSIPAGTATDCRTSTSSTRGSGGRTRVACSTTGTRRSPAAVNGDPPDRRRQACYGRPVTPQRVRSTSDRRAERQAPGSRRDRDCRMSWR